MTHTTHTAPGAVDVLVVGAGPTGLTLGAALAAKGVSVTLVDRLPEGANTSRAAVVHARTLEALERIGAADRLVGKGLQCQRFTVRDRDSVLLSLNFDWLPTRYPYALMVSQAVTEAVLLERFQEAGGCLIRPCALANLTQDDHGVDAILDDGRQIRARYLVGADGMHSRVRDLSWIEFAGDSYAQSFILADTRLSGAIPHEQVILYFSTAGLVVVAPLPDGLHRIVATVDEAPEHPQIADVQALLDARGPKRERAIVEDVIWSSRFRVHHRLADRYRQGRVLLAGDAAHVHSPAGGQGMNIGIRDAIMLAAALEDALRNENPSALDRYCVARRPVAQRVVAFTDRLTRIATVSSGLTPLRNLAIRAFSHLGPFRRRLALQLAGLVPDERLPPLSGGFA
jgi:2-polyprenyl-6-methoxyphenol hydroxylase-like FAD-dependent oxidoreductase